MMRVKTAWMLVLGLAAAGCQLDSTDPATGQLQQGSTACDAYWTGSYTAYHAGSTAVKTASSDQVVYVVMEDFNNAPNYVGMLVDTSQAKIVVAYKVAQQDLGSFANDVSTKGHAVLPGPAVPPHPGGTDGLAHIAMAEAVDLVAMAKAANATSSQCP